MTIFLTRVIGTTLDSSFSVLRNHPYETSV
jgi:hypothetical protein